MASKRRRGTAPPRGGAVLRRGKWWFAGGGTTVAIALLFVLSTALSGPETSEPGLAAPDVTLATLSGELQVSDLEGEVVLLYFSFPG